MECILLSKGFWASSNKLLHHHFPDVLATVHTTEEIPKEAILGPCVLPDTELSTVAFIALKCSERRNIHYVIKVDVNSVQSPDGFPWMMLVQAAADKSEQNLEAYLKNSQLYYRPTRKIHSNEELLVWYDDELSWLLGFHEIKASKKLQSELSCPNCKQVFKSEHSYLSHARFLCFRENSVQFWRNLSTPNMMKSRYREQSINVHSLASNLEVKRAAWKGNSNSAVENNQGRKTVLLEKTNFLCEEQHGGIRGNEGPRMSGEALLQFSTEKPMCAEKDALEQNEESAFTEVKQARKRLKVERAKEVEQGGDETLFGKEHDLVRSSSSSAFSFVWPSRFTGESKSVFIKPSICLMDRRAATASQHLSDLVKCPRNLSGCINATDIIQYGSLLTSKFLTSDLNDSRLLQTRCAPSNPFPSTSGIWSRQTEEQMPSLFAPSLPSRSLCASLALLPPTFTSFATAAQNWCAKCSLSFRMTSDLVFHMRSHHKKDGASPESQGKRRREEKLTCPVCQEYFRERHHLSRHMTSHN